MAMEGESHVQTGRELTRQRGGASQRWEEPGITRKMRRPDKCDDEGEHDE